MFPSLCQNFEPKYMYAVSWLQASAQLPTGVTLQNSESTEAPDDSAGASRWRRSVPGKA